MKTPVLYCIFNRLDVVKRTFEPIRKAKPPRFYIAADGPRDEKEKELTDSVRGYVLNNIDWDCEVHTLFREENIGCEEAMSGAIRWFFTNEEAGIVLEDDILCAQSFFEFCEKMLIKYKDDERAGMISGYSQFVYNSSNDYEFSYNGPLWGWASYRRVIFPKDGVEFKFDEKMTLAQNVFKNIEKTKFIKNKIWLNNVRAYLHNNRQWDLTFLLYLLRNLDNALCAICPVKSLTSHIGHEGVHGDNDKSFDVQFYEIDANNLKEPGDVKVNEEFFEWQNLMSQKANYEKYQFKNGNINYFLLCCDLIEYVYKILTLGLKYQIKPQRKKSKYLAHLRYYKALFYFLNAFICSLEYKSRYI